MKALSLKNDRIFFIPGNHDIWRDRDSKVSEAGLHQILNNIDAVNDYIDSGNLEGIKRMLPFKTFGKTFYDGVSNCILTNYHSLFNIELSSMKTGIACLNSAWRSYEDGKDRHNLIIGERQLTAAKNFFKDNTINIALLHHPVEWLADFDRRCIEPLLENTFQLIFSGHVHSGSSWLKSDIYKGLFVSVAPSSWSFRVEEKSIDYSNGYSIVDFDPGSLEIEVTNRRYSHRKNSYVANNDLGNDFGISKFKLPSSGELKLRNYENDLAITITNTHFGELNEHLLTYNTNTKAPRELKSLFVMPKVVEKINFEGEKKTKEKNVSIEELCLYPASQIVFGVKESGKSILLDRILVYLSESIQQHRLIPIHIDFRQIKSSRIETLISRFLGISISFIKDLCSKHKLLLLVDNLSFNEYDSYQLGALQKFLDEAPNVTMIGASFQVAEGAVPIELYNFPFYAGLRKLHIKSFGSSETRLLIKNWFSENPSPDVEDKIEKLLDTFLMLNLPRTPLAISMFLWILEQQENYQPINNATMLEHFIEKLFEKHARKEIYSDRFDFRNKERLLAEIAFRMLENNSENYQMSSRDLIDFIDDSLKAKKFDFIQAKDVLDHFIDKGVFIEEIDDAGIFIRFRFSCFMHYFISRKMDFDPTFKDFVMSEENYLMFTDEIDYYTGIKRDCSDILETVIGRMEKDFKEVINRIMQFPHTFDEIFENQQSMLVKADENFLLRLTDKPKPSQDQIDEIQDNALAKIPVEKGIQKKEAKISDKQKKELLWTLAARVLKNTEETTIPDLKYRSYTSLLHCSMAYAILWKSFIERYIAENEKKEGFKLDEELELQRNVLPLIHELWIKMLIGTTKLSVVFREKIKADEKARDKSDFEKYISTFLYADIRGRDAARHIHNFVKNVRNPHLVDMTLFKLLTYYYLRSKTKESDKQYENLIGDLFVNARNYSNSKKVEIIRDFRKRRKIEQRRKKVQDNDK